MKQPQPPTRSGLLPEARHLVLPAGIRSTGFPAVQETCRSIGIEFDRWQQDLNRCLLAKGEHGLYAADTAVLSIARQVGKTYNVGAVAFALCIATSSLTVVWTGHRFKVARESFNEMRSWAKSPLLAPHIDYEDITTGAGNECIPFRNGSRIVFAARERGAIRGFTKVGMLVLDEAQILTEAALSDLVPTTNQAPNPLVVLMGTPPKPTDPGEVFTRLRQEALAGESSDVLYAELSADANADPDDREQWRKANLSYPDRTPERAIMRLKKLLSTEDFLREGLGIWPESGVPRWLVFPEQAWKVAAADSSAASSRMSDPVAVGVAVAPDREWSAIVAAGHLSAGGRLVEVTGDPAEGLDYRPGTGWLVERLKAIDARQNPCVVVCDDKAIADQLAAAGVEVQPAAPRDVAAGQAMLLDGIAGADPTGRDIYHLGDAQRHMTVAASAVQRRKTGPTTAVWESAGMDISPVRGAALAVWGLAATRVHRSRRVASVASVGGVRTAPPQEAPVDATQARLAEQIERDMAGAGT